VASVARISQTEVSRIERAERQRVSIRTLALIAEALGLDLVVRSYPGDRRVRDHPQLTGLRDLRGRLGPAWRWRYESQVGPNDQRAWDARARHVRTGIEIVVEVETRLTDVQELLRRLALKRDVAPVRLVVVVPETRANRLALREWRDILATELPGSARSTLRALAEGRDPGADCLLVLSSRPSTTDTLADRPPGVD